jgi:hypothetical protein
VNTVMDILLHERRGFLDCRSDNLYVLHSVVCHVQLNIFTFVDTTVSYKNIQI